MVWLRVKTMTRRGQIRKAVKQSYYFLQDKFTLVEDPADIEYFLTQEKDIFEVSKDGKEVKTETDTAVASKVKAGMTKDDAYELDKDEQIKEIKKLGGNPKDYPKEADRVKYIVESYGGR